MGMLEMIGLGLLSAFAVIGMVCLVIVTIFYVKRHKSQTAGAVVEKKTKAQRDLEWAKQLVTKLEDKVSAENKK